MWWTRIRAGARAAFDNWWHQTNLRLCLEHRTAKEHGVNNSVRCGNSGCLRR